MKSKIVSLLNPNRPQVTVDQDTSYTCQVEVTVHSDTVRTFANNVVSVDHVGELTRIAGIAVSQDNTKTDIILRTKAFKYVNTGNK